MIKILTIVGARPQFIKAATVSREIRKIEGLQEVLVHTGQHFDANMSDVFFDQMDIPRPDYQLGIAGGSHGEMTGRMLAAVEEVIIKEKSDWVLIYGDTNSTLAGALAASKVHIPVAHVEAGLRSFNMRMPEEINRVLADRISRVLFCPTDQAVRNLEAEGFRNLDVDILKVGDVMLDAALFYKMRVRRPLALPKDFENQKFALATVHRAENTDEPERLAGIVAGLNVLHKHIPVILPLHPRTRKLLEVHGLALKVQAIDPVGYLEMVWLLDHCRLVLTDSGGLQKEAWFFQKPCVTLRDETEWVELVGAGANRLAGADAEIILNAANAALASRPDFSADLYGKGQAAGRIVQRLLESKGYRQ